MVVAIDEYSAWRTAPDASRLCYQHFCWRELYKSNIHPSINLGGRPNLRIAELAAGHCLWAVQVAEEYPHARVDASDISLDLAPAKPDLPSNVSVSKWSFFDPVPEEWKGAYDLLHVRLIIQPFGGNQDPRPVLDKFVSMLSKGAPRSSGISLTRTYRTWGIPTMGRVRLSPSRKEQCLHRK